MRTGRANVKQLAVMEAMQLELARMSALIEEMNNRIERLEKALKKASALPADLPTGKENQHAKN